AGDEEADAASEAFPDLAHDELVSQAVLELEHPRGLLALGTQLSGPVADALSPAEELELDAALGLHHHLDPRVGLLEDARGGAHEGRPDNRDVVDDLVDPAVDGGRETYLERDGEEHLPEDVRQRQPE